MSHQFPVTRFIPGLHEVADFDCGFDPISEWLQDRIHEAAWVDSARIMVALDGQIVGGFYVLYSTAIKFKQAPSSLTTMQGDKYDIPALYLKAIAVDRRYQGAGLGSDLLLHAMATAVRVADLGVTAHAFWLNPATADLVAWYAERGFVPFNAADPSKGMYLTMGQLAASFREAEEPSS